MSTVGRFRDLTGLTFGMLTVRSLAATQTSKNKSWLCECDCGNTVSVLGVNLKTARTRSCGCKKLGGVHSLVNQRFGSLTVKCRARATAGHHLRWRCMCDCGNIVIVKGERLTAGARLRCSACRLPPPQADKPKKHTSDVKKRRATQNARTSKQAQTTLGEYHDIDALAPILQHDDISIDDLYPKPTARSPEFMLMLAVLHDAIVSLTNQDAFARAEAEYWIMVGWDRDDAVTKLFSFESVCESVGLDPDFLRSGLKRKFRLREKLPEPARPQRTGRPRAEAA